MTDEQKKKFCEECDKSGNLDFPLVGQILSPICSICKNCDVHYGTLNPPTCNVLGKIPKDLRGCRTYKCSSFLHDEKSKSNQFFDENFNPINP